MFSKTKFVGILLFFALISIAAVSGCDQNQGSQRFTVTYSVSGTFSDCTVFYITRQDDVGPDEVNRGGQSLDADVTLPWSHTFDVTVTPMFPFNTYIGAVCSDPDGGDVQVVLSVDGKIEDSDQASGRDVSAAAEHTLTVD